MNAFLQTAPGHRLGCFNCAENLALAEQGTDSRFAVGYGARQQECPSCGMQTFYDVLAVLESAAGFYIGLADSTGPVSRESERYWPTREQAQEALATGRWIRRRSS
ncbi:MAG: hypothetical protein OEL20_05205 [Sulfuritalea sp.]|nr:hypothetical protein [Sulfuritalea sp.]